MRLIFLVSTLLICCLLSDIIIRQVRLGRIAIWRVKNGFCAIYIRADRTIGKICVKTSSPELIPPQVPRGKIGFTIQYLCRKYLLLNANKKQPNPY